MKSEVWLQHLTWEEVGQRIEESGQTIILPVGSTEQHGPHLPLGSDTLVANALAESAAVRAGVLVAPPMWFGWSPHHMVLPGTITIRPEVLVEVWCDMVGSLAQHGFRRFVFLNGHRIVNVAWLQLAGERVKRQLGVQAVIFDPAYMSKELCAELGWGPVGHAEEIEGSHLWFYYPDLVKMDRAVDHAHVQRPLYHVDPGHGGDTLCYVPSSPDEMRAQAAASGGTSGEPSKASREGCERYHRYLVDRLVQVIEILRAR
jgi:creatinine amidohydrolase